MRKTNILEIKSSANPLTRWVRVWTEFQTHYEYKFFNKYRYVSRIEFEMTKSNGFVAISIRRPLPCSTSRGRIPLPVSPASRCRTETFGSVGRLPGSSSRVSFSNAVRFLFRISHVLVIYLVHPNPKTCLLGWRLGVASHDMLFTRFDFSPARLYLDTILFITIHMVWKRLGCKLV